MSGNRISVVRLFNTTTWTYVDLPGLHQNPETIRYSNDGRYIAILETRNDGLSNLKIYDISVQGQPQIVRTIVIEQVVDRMDSFAFCPTGEYLVIGWNLGEKLRVYKTSDWTIVQTAFDDDWLNQTLVNGVRFSNDGTRMYVCGTTTHPDGAVAVYDMVNWVRMPEYKVPAVSSAYWMDVNSAKNQMALYDGRTLRFINMAPWAVLAEVLVDDGLHTYTGVDYNEDGNYVAVVGGTTGAVVYNTSNYQVTSDLIEMGVNKGGSAVFEKRLPVAPSFGRVDRPQVNLGIVALGLTDTIRVYQIDTQEYLYEIPSSVMNSEGNFSLNEVNVSRDGQKIAALWDDSGSWGGF